MHMHMHMHIHMHIPMHIVCVCDGGAGKDLAFSAEIVSHGAVKPLVVMLASAQTETRGYACIYSLHKTYRCTCAHMHRDARVRGRWRLVWTRPLALGLDTHPSAVKDTPLSLVKDAIYTHMRMQHMRMRTHTSRYAAACLSCLCAIEDARQIIREVNGVEPLLKLARGPPTWLRSQVHTHTCTRSTYMAPVAGRM